MDDYKTINETILFIKNELCSLYPENEINSFISIIFEHVFGFSNMDVHTKSDTNLPNSGIIQINNIVSELKKQKPLQYILERTEFYYCTLKVTPDVYIPRPETEELVDWIIKDNPDIPDKILDIGTGSGCIAIALAKMFKKAAVDACDISVKALDIARFNAQQNNTDINFFTYDIIKWRENKILPGKYDILISNPPYVREKEKQGMLPNVIDFEPHTALFVPDEDPLVFYRAIAEFGLEYLSENGKLYFEINEFLGDEIKKMLSDRSWSNIRIRKDINDKNRMVCAVLIESGGTFDFNEGEIKEQEL